MRLLFAFIIELNGGGTPAPTYKFHPIDNVTGLPQEDNGPVVCLGKHLDLLPSLECDATSLDDIAVWLAGSRFNAAVRGKIHEVR
jgi:hypothetical protein